MIQSSSATLNGFLHAQALRTVFYREAPPDYFIFSW